MRRRWRRLPLPFESATITEEQFSNLMAEIAAISKTETIFLNTGYKDRLTVKAMGAMWNPDCKRWSCTAGQATSAPGFWYPHFDLGLNAKSLAKLGASHPRLESLLDSIIRPKAS